MKVNKNIIFTCVLIFLVVSYSFKESFSTPNVEIQEIQFAVNYEHLGTSAWIRLSKENNQNN